VIIYLHGESAVAYTRTCIRTHASATHSLSRPPRTIYISPCSPETHQTIVTSDILPTTSGDRACCIHVPEKCLKEGEHWQEFFSKGAHRRRSASFNLSAGPSDSGGNNINPSEKAVSFHFHHHPLSPDLGPGFASDMFSITIDEVNKRRRSTDFSADDVAVALHERIQSDSADHERGGSSRKWSVVPTTTNTVIVADRRRRGPVVPIAEFTTTITEWVSSSQS
jgi:hypothetical protein